MQVHNPKWEQLLSGVRRFVATRVAATDVDDVVHDIFLRANRSLAQLRDKQRTENWLVGIARRAIADYYRKREPEKGASASGIAVEPIDESRVPPENLASYEGEHDVHEEVLSWLRPMAEDLAEPYRTALIKADFDGVPQKELARQIGLSESGLKSRVQRARRMLREALQRCCEVEFGGEGRAVAFRRLRDAGCCED